MGEHLPSTGSSDPCAVDLLPSNHLVVTLTRAGLSPGGAQHAKDKNVSRVPTQGQTFCLIMLSDQLLSKLYPHSWNLPSGQRRGSRTGVGASIKDNLSLDKIQR